MQYNSPVSMIGNLYSGTDPKDLIVAKKKLLAELDLNGGSTLTINNREFTKNDIINFFDNAQQTSEMAYHVAVAHDVFLLKFLENNMLENRHGFEKNTLYNDPKFIDWVSPYFYTAFTTFGKECIKKANAEDWIALLDSPMLMNEKDKADAWSFFEEEFTFYLRHLQSVAGAAPTISMADMNRLCNFNFIRIIKKLPPQRFYSLIDAYATAIGNAAVIAFKKGDRDGAGTYLDNAVTLAFSTSVRSDLEKKRNDWEVAMAKLSGTTGGGGYSGVSSGGSIGTRSTLGIVLTIILIILRIVACNMRYH